MKETAAPGKCKFLSQHTCVPNSCAFKHIFLGFSKFIDYIQSAYVHTCILRKIFKNLKAI